MYPGYTTCNETHLFCVVYKFYLILYDQQRFSMERYVTLTNL